jgi:hypothetical protein
LLSSAAQLAGKAASGPKPPPTTTEMA